MARVWSEDAAFGELRSRLNGAATFEGFLGIWRLLEQAEEHAPGVYADRWVAYVAGELGRWPSRVRGLEVYDQDEAAAYAARPWAGLVGSLSLFNLDMGDEAAARWVAQGLRADFEGLEHLEFYAMSVRKASVQRACDAGAFDGLTSLVFAQCAFKATTLDVLMSRLEARAEVTRLGFTGSMTQKTIDRLFSSPLSSSLTHLDLSSTPGLKARGVKAIAEHAHVFEALEVLDLSGTRVSSVTAGELARSDWADSFGYLDLRESHIKSDGVMAFFEAGKVELLCPPDGEPLLDLSWFMISDDGLSALAEHPELAGVAGLSLYGNSVQRLEPLLVSPHLGPLHTLDLSVLQLQTSAEVVLELVAKTTPRTFAMASTKVMADSDVVALCALECAEDFEVLDLLGSETASDYGPDALDALLALEERGRLTSVTFSAVVSEDTALAERARANGRYRVEARSYLPPGMLSVSRLDGVDLG